MAILDVLHFPDERLRLKAAPVSVIDANIIDIANNMLETMYAENGIGLAATQVNIQKRIIVIDISLERNEPMVLINPEITTAKGKNSIREGCLSVPDYFGEVERADTIEFTYQNKHGETISTVKDGLVAICIQHEIDHLNGKLFIDYLSPLKQERLNKKLRKQEKYQHAAAI